MMEDKEESVFGWRGLVKALGLLLLVSAASLLIVKVTRPRKKELPTPPPTPAAEPIRRQSTGKILPPQVAGQFYPGDPAELRTTVGSLLNRAPSCGLRGVRAVVAPHAGYVYSGETAGAVYREIPDDFHTVFILGDNHNTFATHSGASLPDADYMELPGCRVPLSAICDDLREEHPKLFTHDRDAHETHIIEVQLPFLLARQGWPAKPGFTIVPMVLGYMTDRQVQELAEVLERYDQPGTVFVTSTDLSHYRPDSEARKIDDFTITRILSREPEKLKSGMCCGLRSVETILHMARARKWQPSFLDYTNSGSTSGDLTRVVGYGAVALTEPLELTAAEGDELIRYAREVVETYVRDGHRLEMKTDCLERHPILSVRRGVFVTLKKEGELRGCIGRLTELQPLHVGVRESAISAATEDKRFSPVQADELDELEYSISILDYPCRLPADPAEYAAKIRPEVDGVILTIGNRKSTFLPQVWKSLPDPEQFLDQLCRKQGAAPSAWKRDDAVVHTYSAHVVRE